MKTILRFILNMVYAYGEDSVITVIVGIFLVLIITMIVILK